MATSLAAMLALFNDNTSGDISAADGRSVIDGLFYHASWDADTGTDPPNAIDDDFGDAKWTATHAGTAPTWTVGVDGRLYSSFPAEATGNMKLRHQAIPAGDFDIRTKIVGYTSMGANYQKPCGLWVAEGTTTASHDMKGILVRNGGGVHSINVTTLTSWSTFSAETDLATGRVPTPLYLRVTRATATYTWQFSGDGMAWITVQSGTLAFTPTIIGVGGMPENGTHGVGAVYEWFRRIA